MQYKDDLIAIRNGAFAFLAVCLIMASFVALYAASTFIKVETENIIEWAQELSLFAGAAILFRTASLTNAGEGKAGIILMAGFFSSMFIRELDAYGDFISHSLWFYVLLVFLAPLLWRVFRLGFADAVKGVADFVRSRSFVTLMVGVAVILVYARLYGSGHMWAYFFPDDIVSRNISKRISEESCELLGYFFMTVGAFSYYFERTRK